MSSGKTEFNVNIFDYSSVAYCVMELVLDEKNQPVDWICRYCNQAFADLRNYRLDAMIDRPFRSLSPYVDEKWLKIYYQAAYENRTSEIDLELEERYHAVIMPVGKKGFCSGMFYAAKTKERELKKKDRIAEERYVLNKLMPEYVSLYRIDLISGKYEVLRLSENTNARHLADQRRNQFATFDEYAKHYAEAFVPVENRTEFLDWHSCQNLRKNFHNTDMLTYHYHSVSREGKDRYFEAYAVKGQTDDEKYEIFLGYRNIDSILYKEKAIQRQLKNALQEVQLSNEIVAAIAKTYQYISRIDIQADRFEEIVNRDKNHLDFIKSGVLSENNKRVCGKYVSEEYIDTFLKFTDITTLPERMEKEESIDLEYRMKDGNWHKMRFIEKKRDENGQLTHALCAIRSISETKKREQELLYQIAEAKKDVIQKNRFLDNISHDIRTPMNGIIGMLELANRYPNDLNMQKKCRDKIMESSRYLVSLVNDILDMNKLESGDVAEQNIPFDLAEVLRKMNIRTQVQATDKMIDYIVDWGQEGLKYQYLNGNPIYLERLLTAVAENAVKFTNPGGHVQVWCKELSEEAGWVVYEFGCSDNGIGMSEEFVTHAFDMFSQENETSRSRYEGSGLGLAIARKIVDILGGTIQIESEKGKGTTVRATLPFQIGQNMETAQTEEQKERSLEGMRVLLAEDNELNREIAECMLESNGMQVESAVDGLDAVEKFQNSEIGYYDVICMDIMMPNLNGWDAARKIRTMKRADAENIPIIAMSANSFSEDIIKSKISGMNAHLSKPLNMEILMKNIKKCVSDRENNNENHTCKSYINTV